MKYLLCIITFFLSSHAISQEYTRGNVDIIGLAPYTGNRPHKPITENIIRIVVNDSTWGAGSDCRNNSADLQASETHLLSILLMAWATEKSVRITVDDTLRPVDTVCQVTAIYVE